MPSNPEQLRFCDDEDTEVESQISSGLSTPADERQIPAWAAPTNWLKRARSELFWDRDIKKNELGLRSLESSCLATRRNRRDWCRFALLVLAIFLLIGTMAGLSYISLVKALIHRLTPSELRSGLQHIVDDWKEPDSNGAYQFAWREDFSRDIAPKNCHSHNDYWRAVPVYSALAAGCTGIEADIWLLPDNELRVSHSQHSISPSRTFKNLYLSPLINIFTSRNVSLASADEPKEIGVFDADPDISITLLIDFKNDGEKSTGEKIWPVLLAQLQPLGDAGWLTHYNGTTLIPGPLTIVATGHAPLNLIQSQSPNRFIFYDAPLNDISNPIYDSSNSYYASVGFRSAVGFLWFNKFSSGQVEIVKTQIQAAQKKGLVSRYWNTPDWPISTRRRVWETLTENGVGMLNVDDLEGATRWDWGWCVVAGLSLCG